MGVDSSVDVQLRTLARDSDAQDNRYFAIAQYPRLACDECRIEKTLVSNTLMWFSVTLKLQNFSQFCKLQDNNLKTTPV